MKHDGRGRTYAKLIQKSVHSLVCVSTENECVKKVSRLELELIKGEDGDDRAKWEHCCSFFNFNAASVSLQFHRISMFLWIKN